MKKFYFFFEKLSTNKLTFLFVLFSFFISSAQVTTNSGSGLAANYPDLAAAITALNGATITSPVVITLTGNETAPVGGYRITAQGDATNTIIVEGVTSTITASPALTVGALNDAIFKLVGADYITIRNFTMQENVLNTVTTAASNTMTEWGIALLYITTTNGSQNITIQNNTISLNRTYQNTFGVYANSTHTENTVTTSATATTTSGGNSDLKIYSNSISNVNNGVVIVGATAAADHNTGIDIGGSSLATANTITNYGTTGTFSGYANVSGSVNGILVRNSYGFNISYNTVTSSVGGVIAGTLNGIQVAASSNAPTTTFTNTISYNSISLRSGLIAGAMNGINYPSGSASATSTLNINNNDFNNFGHTVSGTGAIVFISTASSNQFTSISSNTFTNISVNTTGSVTFIAHGYSIPATGSLLINNNSIVTAFAKTGAGASVVLTTSNSTSGTGSVCNYSNNNFSNISLTGATSITGFNNTDGGTGSTKAITGNVFNNWTTGTSAINAMNFTYWNGISSLSNNTITNLNGQAAITGMTIGSASNAATSVSVGNNIINNLVSSGTGGTVIGITCSNTSIGITISGNVINTLSSTGASPVSGIVISGANAAGTNVFKNKIYDLSGSNANSTVNGLLISGGTLVTAYNNIIGDIRTPIANAANPLVGINITGGTTVNAYYNTVMLNGSSTGALFGSSAISVSTTPTVALRNNIFVNNSSVTGAGLAASHRRSTTTLTTYAAASNNNLFFGSTIFTDGTNTDITLAAFKTRVGTRDTASITENPTFVSTAGSNLNFLHIDTVLATQIESGGATVSGITDDFDGNVRNVTTPDVGADEFTGVIADFIAPTISHTAPTATCIQGNRTISATLTDASGIGTGIGLPIAYWRINAGAYIAATGVDMGAGVYDFTIGSGSVYGDVITYYFVAQDNAASPNIAALPLAGAAGFSINPPAVSTVPTTPFSTTVLSALSGTYTVGAAGNYTTLTAAVNDYNIRCLSGPVVFDLLDATYPSETFPITIQQNADTNATNTLTIKPATGVTATITGSNSNAIIKLNGADYVTIDGSNNGTNSKDLTITNTNTGTTSAVVWNGSASASNGASNITIKNSNILGNAPLTTFVGVFSGSGTTMGAIAESANNNFIVQNNSVAKSQYGIAIAGAATTNTGNIISNNSIGSNTVADYIGFIGVFASNNNGIEIKNNTIFNIITTGANPIGINIAANVINSIIDSNNISGVAYTGTTGYGGKGMNINTGTATSNLTVSNNTISNIRGDGWNSLLGDSTVGIRIGATGGATVTTGGIKLYNNSINLGSGAFAGNGSGTRSAALFLSSTTSNLDIRNNIFVTNLFNSNAALAKTYSIYSDVANTAFTNIDFNNYTVLGTQGVLGYLTSDRTNLAGIVAGFGQNVASLNVTPVFVSATDLHLVTTTNTAIDNKGTTIAGVTLDIDGNVRNVTTPDMGADEFTSTACTSAIGGTASALVSTFCDSGSTTISSIGYSTGFSTTYQWQSSVDLAFTTPINQGAALTVYADLVTPAITATRYYRLAVTCVENGQANFSNVVTITINTTPVADAPANVTACDSYILPALTVGNYFTGAGGTGTALSAGNSIASTQTIYVYAETGTTPNCTDENSFSVTINTSPVADAPANVTACDSYILPALTVGNYFTGAGGTGTALSAGNSIASSQTIYVYAETGTTPNCTDENSFSVTINTSPVADAPANVSVCDSYILPALTVGNYFTGAGGTGTALSAGNSITSTQTIYVYAETGTTPNCTDENSFTVTITSATISGATTQVINGGVAADATIEDIVVTSNGTVTWFASSADATANTNPLAVGTQLVDGNIYYGVTNIGTCRSTTLAVTVTVVLGTSSFDLSQLNYYPNPVKDIFNVKYNKEIISVDVYDLTGRKVIEMKPNTLEVQLNMTNLSNAMYIVRLQSVDGITELKVYKN